MDRAVQTLTFDDILYINWQMYERFGGLYLSGDDNLHNPGSLEYILGACQGLIFGVDRYPAAIDKAAAIGWHIITRHVFHDGNKRTGMEVCRVMLERNGYSLVLDQDETIDFAVRTGDGQVSEEDFTSWIRQRTFR